MESFCGRGQVTDDLSEPDCTMPSVISALSLATSIISRFLSSLRRGVHLLKYVKFLIIVMVGLFVLNTMDE